MDAAPHRGQRIPHAAAHRVWRARGRGSEQVHGHRLETRRDHEDRAQAPVGAGPRAEEAAGGTVESRRREAPGRARARRPGHGEPHAAAEGRAGGVRDHRRVLPSAARGLRRIPPRRGCMNNYPAVIPMIAYENGPAAMDWLARAFGFRERDRRVTPEGRLEHGEMDTGEGGVVMMATPSPHYHGPKKHRE